MTPQLRRRLASLVLLLVRHRPARALLVRRLAGWSVSPEAAVGWCWIEAASVSIAAGARVGSGSVIRGLEELRLDLGARIGSFNWISGPSLESTLYPHCPDRWPALLMGADSAITSRHRLDCSDSIVMEPLSLLTGNGSQILTHGIDFQNSRQSTQPVRIGRASVLMSRVLLLPGTDIPARVLVAAGATVTASPMDELTMYGGVPARPIKKLDDALTFFHRSPGSPVE